MEKNIILIGFMGCGKSSVGVKLSWVLKLPVIDTDKLIEARLKMRINQIFEEKGEEFFRCMETQVLEELSLKKNRKIISVGGGTPIREENRELLRKSGIVVYLRIKPSSVLERLRDDDTRPLLKCDNPLEQIEKLMSSRKAFYEECADITIDVDDLQTEDIVAVIQDVYRKGIKR